MFPNDDLALVEGTADSFAALAELAVAQLYVLPQTIQATDAVTLGADVRNDGGAESGAFLVRFALDGETHDVQFPSLAPGASHWEEWQHAPLNPGAHLISVQLDVQDQVREGNKQDNTASLAFQINGALPFENLIADDATVIDMDAEVILASDDADKKKDRRADPEEQAPKCQAAAHDLEVLHDYLNWLARELGKPTPNPKKPEDLHKLVRSQVDGIIASLDSYIAAGCCEPSLKTLETEVNGLPWAVDPSAEVEHTRLVQAIKQAQEKARKDFEHC